MIVDSTINVIYIRIAGTEPTVTVPSHPGAGISAILDDSELDMKLFRVDTPIPGRYDITIIGTDADYEVQVTGNSTFNIESGWVIWCPECDYNTYSICDSFRQPIGGKLLLHIAYLYPFPIP